MRALLSRHRREGEMRMEDAASPMLAKGKHLLLRGFCTACLTVNCCFGRFHSSKYFEYCTVGRKKWNNLVVNEGEWLAGF